MPAPDSLRDRQADAVVVGLGAEKRLGRASQDIRAHSAAGVSDRDDQPVSRVDVGGDLDRSRTVGQCLASVLQQITQHRRQPGGITGNRRDRTQIENPVNPVGRDALFGFDLLTDQLIEVDDRGFRAGRAAFDRGRATCPVDQLARDLDASSAVSTIAVPDISSSEESGTPPP